MQNFVSMKNRGSFATTVCPSINESIIPVTMKICPKPARQNFDSMQNRETVSTNVCLSIDEFWNMNINFLHAEPWKANLYQQNIQVERQLFHKTVLL